MQYLDLIVVFLMRKRPHLNNHDSDNKGYIERLNQGIMLAKGIYIARMDQDDISIPERLDKQFNFMEGNKDIVLCGSWYENIGFQKNMAKLPLKDEDIRIGLLYTNTFCHPSIIMRTSVIKENELYYNASLIPAEDYKFWMDISKYGKVANLPFFLIKYRTHNKNTANSVRTSASWDNRAMVQKNLHS